MRIQTFSIVVGTRACDAHCPFCVSKMTGFGRLPPRSGGINWRNFNKACRLAEIGGTTTVLLTGKGEPMLYPDEVVAYLSALHDRFRFPLIELQTNSIQLGRLMNGKPAVGGLTAQGLDVWREEGLNTFAVSAVSVERPVNAKVYGKDYPDLDRLTDFLHGLGFSIRLCLMLMRGGIDNSDRLHQAIDFCREHGIEQITARPIRKPTACKDEKVAAYVAANTVFPRDWDAMRRWVADKGTKLLSLMHGAEVYDIDGQNFCLSDCLTVNQGGEDVRTLIFYSDGRLAYDWQYDGAVILGGHDRR